MTTPHTHEAIEQLLPEYALGTLDAAHRSAVDAHLETCAACRVTLEELAGAVTLLERESAHELPAVSDADVIASRAALLDVVEHVEQEHAAPADAPAPARAGRSRRRFVPSPSGWAVGALACTCVVLVAITMDRGSRIDSLEGKLKDARGDQVAVLRGASVKNLDTAGPFGDARGQVVVRRDAGIVAFRDVPAPADGMVWQVWAIDGDTITSLGIIDGERSSAFLSLEDVDPDDIERIIVTLEPAGGSQEPTATEVAEGTV